MGHGAGTNSEVNNLLSLTPGPAARSKPPRRWGSVSRRPAARHTTGLQQRAARQCRPSARPHGHGAAGPTVAVVDRYRRDAGSEPISPRRAAAVPGSILGAQLGFWVWAVAVWADAATTRVLTSRGRRRTQLKQIRRGEGWVVKFLLGAGPLALRMAEPPHGGPYWAIICFLFSAKEWKRFSFFFLKLLLALWPWINRLMLSPIAST